MSEVASVVTFGLSDVLQGKKPFAAVSGGSKTEKTDAGDAVKKEAEQKALLEQQAEESKKAKRAALSSQPTSGFGANTNLARSFLTSL